MRAASGASRGAIVRQLLSESALLALAGGVAGVGLAALLTPVLVAHAPGAAAILSARDFKMQPEVFLFALGIAVATGIAAGYSRHCNLRAPIWPWACGRSRAHNPSRRSHARFRDALIAAEVALSLVLLIAAGLLQHSFARLTGVRPGIRTDNMLTMRFSLPNTYKGPAANSGVCMQVSQRLQTVPGVAAVGLCSCPLVSGWCNTLFFYREDRPFTQGRCLVAREWSIDPNYLAAAGTPLLRGRNFTKQDGIGFDRKNPRPGSILISEVMARQFFAGEDPSANASSSITKFSAGGCRDRRCQTTK